MAAEEASTRCQAFRRQPLGQAEGRLCVAWPVRCAAQSCVNCGSILCFLSEVRTSCSWWKAVPPLACSVDRAGRRHRSAAASAARRCSTLLPGGQHAGAVRGVCEAALALYCQPRRVARGTRGAARGPDGARERARWASRRGASAVQAGTSSACCRQFSGRRRSISRLSIKTGGLCDAVYAIVFGFAFSFACFYFVFSFAKRRRGGAGGR